MTPCEKLGYKVGEVFEVIEAGNFYLGDIIVLIKDDDSHCPKFINPKNKAEDWKSLERVKRVYPPEESKTVSVICEGKTTEISREWAKAYNLI